MIRRFSRLGVAVFSASAGMIAAAHAQSYPTYFAPRCQPDELRSGPGPQDPCRPQIALFGLNGPTVIGAGEVDVETTGSVARADRRPDRKGAGKDAAQE
jgi:hypothetical protein